MYYLRYQYRLYPTEGQKVLLAKAFGCNRLIWNYFLDKENKHYEETKKFLFYHKKIELLKDLKLQKEFDFLKEINSQTYQQTLKHQDTAFKNFFRDKKRFEYPKFKCKRNRQSITFPQHTKVNYESSYTNLCKLGNVPTIFHRKLKGRISSCTVSKTPADNYYISFCCEIQKEMPAKLPIEADKSLGIDLGAIDFLVSSDGTKIANPKFYTNSQKKLAHHQRSLSRKTKGSKNYEEQRIVVAKVHEENTNKKKDFFFNIIKYLCNDDQITSVFAENLNIKGMLSNHKLARIISDSSWGKFLEFLEYKLTLNGKNLVRIERFFASSKTCNNCAYHNKDLRLGDRIWICPNCGARLDRDLNAAKNIKEFGLTGTITSKILSTYITSNSTLPRKAASGEVKERSMELMISTSADSL